jgi:hypothetical protein
MGKCPSPHMTTTVTSFSHSKVAGWVPPLLPSLASLFICSSHERVPLPHSLELRESHPLYYMSLFFQLLVYYSACFFSSLGRGQSVQGAMLICPREYHVLLICSPCGLCLPSSIGAGIWCTGALLVLHLMWVGMLCMGWGCDSVRVLPLLGVFSCQVHLQHLSKSLPWEARFLLPPSSNHLGISILLVLSK